MAAPVTALHPDHAAATFGGPPGVAATLASGSVEGIGATLKAAGSTVGGNVPEFRTGTRWR